LELRAVETAGASVIDILDARLLARNARRPKL